MKKSRPEQADIFVRRPIVELRASLNRLDIAAESDIAGLEPFMEATIAAAMIIAHADGEADVSERRRIISLFRSNPTLQAFSAEDIAREIRRIFARLRSRSIDAPSKARAQIVTTDLSNEQFRALMDICLSVLEADGVRHPAEEAALATISAMRPWGFR